MSDIHPIQAFAAATKPREKPPLPPQPERPRPFTRWRHRKGNEYVVLGVGMIEATLTAAVLYRRCDGGDPLVWVRPLAEFLDGRFTEVEA